jgi:hypothetical protein
MKNSCWHNGILLQPRKTITFLGALSRPAGSQGLETETADDFALTEVTVVSGATIHGLIPTDTAVSRITRVEVEIYHIFPLDSDPGRTSAYIQSKEKKRTVRQGKELSS